MLGNTKIYNSYLLKPKNKRRDGKLINLILICRYDREEGNAMYDDDRTSAFLGDEASFQKKEAELTKRLVCPENCEEMYIC